MNIGYKILSVLLIYPTQELMESAPEIRRSVRESVRPTVRDAVESFLEYIERTDLHALQEAYTRTFDLSNDMTLHMTYYVHGDTPNRGMALSDLNQRYRAAGFENFTSELPDFLPLMLEFFSICGVHERITLLTTFDDGLNTLALRLKDHASPYEKLVGLVCSSELPLEPAGE